ncbi:MAG: hypothetical protein QGD96_12200, partial [Anaerolineae bacterium]|nr:hypothetical protein [Anaerolineae bacterium]
SHKYGILISFCPTKRASRPCSAGRDETARQVGFVPLKRDDFTLEHLPYNRHRPHSPTSGYPG